MNSLAPLPKDVFDTVTGLPVHPLVVHAAVVLLPLSAVLVMAVVLIPRLRRAYALPTVILTVLAGLAALVAKESGEALGHRIAEPEDHAEWGDRLFAGAGVFVLLTLAWWLLSWWGARNGVQTRTAATAGDGQEERGSHAARGIRESALVRILGALASLAGVAVLVLTLLTGHSGAQATWGDVLPAAATSAPTSVPAGSYTMAQVREHDSAASCWAAVDGSVYDLTAWINGHPGGPRAIQGLCGTDATAAFTAKHSGDAAPASRLATFKLGPLG